MLKKLPFLKKKDSAESNLQVNHDQQRNPQEAHFSGSHPSTSPHSATQRTTQVLPLLVKSAAAPMEARKKSQPPALVLPELGLRTTRKSLPGAAQAEDKQGKKEPTSLQRVYDRSHRSSLPQGRRRSPDAIMPLYPELSDECFRPLWESKKPLKGRSVKDTLEMMDEKEILDTILDHLRPSLHISAEPKLPRKKMDGFPSLHQKSTIQESSSHHLSQEKILLYKYYGVKLRNSRQKDLVKEHLKRLLGFSLQEETDREVSGKRRRRRRRRKRGEEDKKERRTMGSCGVTERRRRRRRRKKKRGEEDKKERRTMGDVGHFGHAKTPAVLEATFEDPHSLSERQFRTALILCYGQAAMGAQPEEVIALVEHIVSEILFQYSTKNKDEALKKAFMRSVIMITKALVHTRRQDVNLPHKSELVINVIEVIENEPARSLSVIILHQAIITITCMTRLKPTLNTEVMSKLVNTSIQRVFSLPALKMTKVNAASPTQSTYTQDFYHQTVTACSSMLTSLLSEAPNLDSLQEILMHTNTWIESPKIHERERAIKSTWHLLKFVSEHTDFDTTADFFLLGQLVALLGLHIGEGKEIGQTSAEAAYHLHYILMNKMGPADCVNLKKDRGRERERGRGRRERGREKGGREGGRKREGGQRGRGREREGREGREGGREREREEREGGQRQRGREREREGKEERERERESACLV
ncbi:maestro heat-like repeat family member 5 [Crotalus adamanteus]|uniref:Maestro heat-like repeat family member 5 n=1 Tax=Crotalus adamanteus TaxID=8729 RepID=A0AAW1C3T1_CROAD